MVTEVPRIATYTSQDGKFAIKIKTANGSTGSISGEYKTNESPEGPIHDQQSSGGFGWVHNDRMRRNDVAPFPIQVTGVKRGDQFGYAIVDVWNGAYQEDNTLRLSGSRSYVNHLGAIEVTSLGTQTFSM